MRLSILITTGLLLSATSSFAAHPQRYERPDVQLLAHELEEAARHVYREARAARHHYDRGESYALKRLDKLESRAKHFHRQVEKHRQSPYHTEHDYLELRDAYFHAAESLPALHGISHVRRDFARVGRLMAQLDRYFFRYADGRYRSDRHGRYDRDRHPVHRTRPRHYRFGGWWHW